MTTLSIELVFQAAGGLALFLLAMQMMTDGLKAFAGKHLRTLLSRWTRTPLRGVGAGFLITGLVQSSGAVTVATIGFVNAGLLSLQQALGVVFGANLGTTMTGWLVSLVGFGFKVENFALPILAIGVGFASLPIVIAGNLFATPRPDSVCFSWGWRCCSKRLMALPAPWGRTPCSPSTTAGPCSLPWVLSPHC